MSTPVVFMISIGVCAKNEYRTISRTLDSVLVAARKLGFSWEVLICINGSTDSTDAVVKKWADRNPDANIRIFNQNIGNLVEAQREIIANKKESSSPTIFVDADVLVDPDCFVHLAAAVQDPRTLVAYAVSKPQNQSQSTTLIEKTLNLYDSERTIFSPRRHLHGRTFIIKKWHIPSVNPPLLVDDIFLSLNIQKENGAEAITKVPRAIVYAQQIRHWGDYYKVYKRRFVEIRKCLMLFPGFKSLPPEYVNRRIQVKTLLKSTPKELFLWCVLFFIRFAAKVKLKVDLFVHPVLREQWEQPISTKRLRQIPLVVLFEGVDCSGKKTAARSAAEFLRDHGVCVEISIGPLSGSWYAAFSRFVSLHRCPNFLRSIVYAFDGVGDKRGALRFNSDVILQISSPLRGWAYSEATKNRLRMVLSSFVVRNFLAKYDQVWYLTAPYTIRKARHKNQVAAGENPDQEKRRFRNEAFFVEYENSLVSKLQSTTGILEIIDSSVYSSRDIGEKIGNAIIKEI